MKGGALATCGPREGRTPITLPVVLRALPELLDCVKGTGATGHSEPYAISRALYLPEQIRKEARRRHDLGTMSVPQLELNVPERELKQC